MKPAYELTLAQYARQEWQRMADDYGISKAEAARTYPREHLSSRHWQEIHEAVRFEKCVLTRVVLDDLYRHNPHDIYILRKFYPASVPDDYFTPDERELHRQHAADMRAARQRGQTRQPTT